MDAFAGTLNDTCPCSSEASEAVAESAESDAIDQSAEADAEAAGEAANEGTAAASPEAQAEANEEASNEGTGSAGGHDSMNEFNNEQAASGGSSSSDRKRSWLEVLAGDLADIQNTFLDKAMAAKDIMAGEADSAGTGEGKSAAFLDAQAEYTATMQLFTIFSNQTSTSIKSIGDKLAGIARKQ